MIAAAFSASVGRVLASAAARWSAHRDAAFALADSVGALRPTARVLDSLERFPQWHDRALWAQRCTGEARTAAVAEADLYSGRPPPPQPFPAPLPAWAFPALDAAAGVAP